MNDTVTQACVLLIDDDSTLADVMARALRRQGFNVSVATSYDEAQLRIQTSQPDCAIVDLKLGSHTGLQLIEALKQCNPNIRILIYTGYSSIATAVEAIRLGAHNYLCKPATIGEIIAALDDTHANPDTAIATHPPSVDRLEWEHIHRILQHNDNNISATARALGMHRRTLQRKLSKHPVRS